MKHVGTAVLFGATMFLSAHLLFVVQPLVGKLLLPALGGTPAVWNSCLVFFQAMMLLGYLLADRVGRTGATRAHLLLLSAIPLLFGVLTLSGLPPLPVATSLLPDDRDNPVPAVLAVLTLAVAVPFAVLAATSPLLQRWYARVSGRDPYFLNVASNAGSLSGLLAYPFAVEPLLTLREQQSLWAWACVACAALIACCAAVASRHAPTADAPIPPAPPVPRGEAWRQIGVAALASSLLSSATIHLTTDVAPVPLLWVVPLGLYLLTFVLVFARRTARVVVPLARRALPATLVLVTFLIAIKSADPPAVVAALHLLGLFVVCLVCHGDLAENRPEPAGLTAFYLRMAVGGVLGSLFCALAAPILFSRLGLVEYPLALALAALVRPRGDGNKFTFRLADIAYPVGVAVLILAAAAAMRDRLVPADASPSSLDRIARNAVIFGLPAVLVFTMDARPIRMALGLVVLLAAGLGDLVSADRTEVTSRNFFGTLRVKTTGDGVFRRLVHGTTQHGQERVGDGCPPRPLMYYHATGPAGRVLRMLPDDRCRRVGVVGLGCGAMASHARPGQKWTFFEIDPAVVRIAKDPTYFTFLKCCPAEYDVRLGDARRTLAADEDEYDVLALDAFSSDAIPTHLLTREALELYFSRLSPRGVLLIHVSNRYLDLAPVVARTAGSLDPDIAVRIDNDFASEKELDEGKTRSTWMLLARRPADLDALKADRRWQSVPEKAGPVWTDDYTSLWGAWTLWGDE